jgi:hypothetical protein
MQLLALWGFSSYHVDFPCSIRNPFWVDLALQIYQRPQLGNIN